MTQKQTFLQFCYQPHFMHTSAQADAFKLNVFTCYQTLFPGLMSCVLYIRAPWQMALQIKFYIMYVAFFSSITHIVKKRVAQSFLPFHFQNANELHNDVMWIRAVLCTVSYDSLLIPPPLHTDALTKSVLVHPSWLPTHKLCRNNCCSVLKAVCKSLLIYQDVTPGKTSHLELCKSNKEIDNVEKKDAFITKLTPLPLPAESTYL